MTAQQTSAPSADAQLRWSLVEGVRLSLFPYPPQSEILSSPSIHAWSNITSNFMMLRIARIEPLRGLDVSSSVHTMETRPDSSEEVKLRIEFDVLLQFYVPKTDDGEDEEEPVEADLLIRNVWRMIEGRTEYIDALRMGIPELQGIEDFEATLPGFLESASGNNPNADDGKNSNATGAGNGSANGDKYGNNERVSNARLAIVIASIVGGLALVTLLGMFLFKRRRTGRKEGMRSDGAKGPDDLSLDISTERQDPPLSRLDQESCAVSATTSRAVMSVTSSGNASCVAPISDSTLHSSTSATTVRAGNTSRPPKRIAPGARRSDRSGRRLPLTPTIFEI